MANKWVQHVKKWAADQKLSYSCALSSPEIKAAYTKTPKPIKPKTLTRFQIEQQKKKDEEAKKKEEEEFKLNKKMMVEVKKPRLKKVNVVEEVKAVEPVKMNTIEPIEFDENHLMNTFNKIKPTAKDVNRIDDRNYILRTEFGIKRKDWSEEYNKIIKPMEDEHKQHKNKISDYKRRLARYEAEPHTYRKPEEPNFPLKLSTHIFSIMDKAKEKTAEKFGTDCIREVCNFQQHFCTHEEYKKKYGSYPFEK